MRDRSGMSGTSLITAEVGALGGDGAHIGPTPSAGPEHGAKPTRATSVVVGPRRDAHAASGSDAGCSPKAPRRPRVRLGMAWAQRPGAEGAKSGVTASFDLSAAWPPRMRGRICPANALARSMGVEDNQ
jgi:hypothetical protein